MYKEYLKSIEIISEEEFNEVIATLPKRKIFFSDVGYSDSFHTKETLAKDLIDYFLEANWENVYLIDIDYDKKVFSIDNVQSIKDLEEIKEFFTGWDIEDYDFLKKDLEEEDKRISLRNIIIKKLDNLNEQDLEEIVNNYVNKK